MCSWCWINVGGQSSAELSQLKHLVSTGAVWRKKRLYLPASGEFSRKRAVVASNDVFSRFGCWVSLTRGGYQAIGHPDSCLGKATQSLSSGLTSGAGAHEVSFILIFKLCFWHIYKSCHKCVVVQATFISCAEQRAFQKAKETTDIGKEAIT